MRISKHFIFFTEFLEKSSQLDAFSQIVIPVVYLPLLFFRILQNQITYFDCFGSLTDVTILSPPARVGSLA